MAKLWQEQKVKFSDVGQYMAPGAQRNFWRIFSCKETIFEYSFWRKIKIFLSDVQQNASKENL